MLASPLLRDYNGPGQTSPGTRGLPEVYVSLLRLFVEVCQKSLLLFVGLVVLLMASWSLIVSAVADIVVRVFDIKS